MSNNFHVASGYHRKCKDVEEVGRLEFSVGRLRLSDHNEGYLEGYTCGVSTSAVRR